MDARQFEILSKQLQLIELLLQQIVNLLKEK
jgi:hypothetical protein